MNLAMIFLLAFELFQTLYFPLSAISRTVAFVSSRFCVAYCVVVLLSAGYLVSIILSSLVVLSLCISSYVCSLSMLACLVSGYFSLCGLSE